MEESCAKLCKGKENRLRCTVGTSPTSFAKELYLVSQDNVIKMARQVKVFAPPARGSKRVCCNTGFVYLIGGEFWQLTMPAETPVKG
jgi:hypothetical protein